MTKTIDLTYNSNKEDLMISEYGRNIQNLINYCKTIENDEERQHFAEKIISLMWQMNPQTGPREDARRKFWTHLMLIADYDLNVKIPDGIEIRTKESIQSEKERIPYPENNKKHRQYGQFVQKMIDKACTMEDEDMRNQYLKIIGSFMKLAYRNWSRENHINDEVVKADMATLINGRFELPDTLELDKINVSFKKKSSRHSKNNRGKQNNKNNRGKSYSSNRRRR